MRPLPTMVGAAVPDIQGKLEPDEKDAILKWLESHWTTLDCPFHGVTTWTVGDVTGTHPFAGRGGGAPGSGPQFGGPSYPLIVVTCDICGYVVLVNAISVGIVKMAPEPTTKEAEPTTGPD